MVQSTVGHVVDPFHVVRVVNNTVDEVRRGVLKTAPWVTEVQGRPPLSGAALLISVNERPSEHGDIERRALLTVGVPRDPARPLWHRMPATRRHLPG